MNILSFNCECCDYLTNKKYNLTRHMMSKHTNNTVFQNNNDTFQNNNNDVFQNNNNNIKIFKCEKCEKILSSKKNLIYHITICKGKLEPFECYLCHKVLSSQQSKSNHIKVCKSKQSENSNITNEEPSIQPTTIINNNTTINNNTIINNITNNTTNNLTINFNETAGVYTQFIKDHITEKAIIDIISKSNNDLSLMVENFHRLLCIDERNICVKKTNKKSAYCSIFNDGKWETKLDENVIPKISIDITYSLKETMTEDQNEKELLKKFKTKKIHEICDKADEIIYTMPNEKIYEKEEIKDTRECFKKINKRLKSSILDTTKT
jgi:hypothetical protein